MALRGQALAQQLQHHARVTGDVQRGRDVFVDLGAVQVDVDDLRARRERLRVAQRAVREAHAHRQQQREPDARGEAHEDILPDRVGAEQKFGFRPVAEEEVVVIEHAHIQAARVAVLVIAHVALRVAQIDILIIPRRIFYRSSRCIHFKPSVCIF